MGLTAVGNQLWDQDSPGVLETAEAEDMFGRALTSSDFNGDGVSYLAVAAPIERIKSCGQCEAGGLHVLFGSVTGLSSAGNQFWTQNSAGIKGHAGPDSFGGALVSPSR